MGGGGRRQGGAQAAATTSVWVGKLPVAVTMQVLHDAFAGSTLAMCVECSVASARRILPSAKQNWLPGTPSRRAPVMV